MFPPPCPDAVHLQAVRAALAAADFTEATARARAGLSSIHEFALGKPLPDDPPPADAVDVLIRLFMAGNAVAHERALSLLGRELLGALTALELLTPAPRDASAVLATVALYPIEGLYVVSDRGEEFPFGRLDGVFPAINPGEPAYLAAIPRTPCASFLEVCGGTGVAALLAARTAGHVWASDVAERSTLFARFNAALNGIENFTAVQGDMYAPLAGRTFDRIVAHPPYVPALQQRAIYRDAGVDGEALTRRVIAEAPDHLAPGGMLYCTCTAPEGDDQPLQARVRGMLGDASADLDVLVLVGGELPPIVHFTREHLLGRHTLEEMTTLVRIYEELRIARMCACTIVLRKRDQQAAPLTLRRERVGTADVTQAAEAVLRWEDFARRADALERLAGVCPRLSPRARLQVTHQPAGEGWTAEDYRVVLPQPLPSQIQASPNGAVFVAWCDGAHTVRALAERLISEGLAPPQEPVRALSALVLGLLKEGVLEAEAPPA